MIVSLYWRGIVVDFCNYSAVRPGALCPQMRRRRDWLVP